MYSEEQRRQHIYDLQTFLRRIQQEAGLPRPLARDGVYGSETAGAVREFQRQNGLPVTGAADFDTWTLIYAQYVPLALGDALPAAAQFFPPQAEAVLRPGSKGGAVYVLQLMLNTMAAHFANMPLIAISGEYDADTADAVSRAQAHLRLPQTGETDRATWNALAAFHNAHVHAPPLYWVLAEQP